LAVVALSTLGVSESRTIFQLLEGLPQADTPSVLLLLENGVEATAQTSIAPLIGTGAVNIVPIDISADQIRCAILAIINGFNVLHPDVTEVLFTGIDAFGLAEKDSPVEPLTPREIQVLNQLASGLSNKAIAKALLISEHTVKFHISAILSKFDVSSRTEAISVGIRAGLVML
jgi:DNA-binding NarL/FixJ family response regulator